MNTHAITRFALVGMLALLGCGGSDHSSSVGNSAINVSLVDGPTTAYQSVLLHIQSVEISKDGSAWTTLATLDGSPIDLLKLTGGVSQTLAKGVTLDAGTYGQLRLILGSTGNTVVLKDGSSHALTIPSGTQTGIKLVGPFVVQPGTTADVWIDFDAAHSIQMVGAGASGKYILRPTVFAYERAVTGSISGTLTDANGGAALPGVSVMAETLDGLGHPSVARATRTDASGQYTLDLLPVGGTYFVVSLPVTATGSVYAPQASDGFNLTSASPVFTFHGSFTASTSLGTLDGSVSPMAADNESDVVRLLGSLAVPSGGASHTFILDSVMAAAGTTAETFDFASLPAGSYSLQAVRTTTNTDGSTTQANSALVPVTLADGASLSTSVSF